jgi:hypothetical protein
METQESGMEMDVAMAMTMECKSEALMWNALVTMEYKSEAWIWNALVTMTMGCKS